MATTTDNRTRTTPAKDPRATPAMRQYYRFKERHPDCVLFFRMGDFYEMFDEDAELAHRVLGITLTERTPGVPMAGVPYHSVESYLRRMIQAGHRVAVCEQVQDPKEAKGVVERDVSRVLTPGTLSDESLLDDSATRNLAAVCFLDAGEEDDSRVAIAVVDVSTGAFTLTDATLASAADELARRSVSELIYAETATGDAPPRAQRVLDALGAPGTGRPGWQFRREEALEAIRDQYRVTTVGGFGLDEDDPALSAAGAVLRYLHETQALGGDGSMRRLAHLAPPMRDDPRGTLILDATTLRALEVERTMRDGSTDGSLLGVFSGAGACRTPMGRRLLREWLVRPLTDRAGIEARQACVSTLASDATAAAALEAALGSMQDAARIAGRLGVGRATPRDLTALGATLSRLDAARDAIDNAPAFESHRQRLESAREALAPLAEEITASCVDDPPAHLREGGLFRDGVDAQLDEARGLQRDASVWLAEYQKRIVEEYKLPGIKVGYNRVFGYYIELTRAQAQHAPDSFIRKQTLKNAERYITPELKEFEDRVMTAEARAVEREQALFEGLCRRCAERAEAIRGFAQTIAELDVLACFARSARRFGWTRPQIVDEPTLDIRDGAHPVLERALGDNFVPNDAALGTTDQPARLALITGPNMAGKSTYIRQTALITLLAHTGSFVPASSATIGLTDRIFTRVGADDALHAGQSTFMVEMVETARILHHATARSLVILDEIGRGTSTLDGLALAWAIAERLADSPHNSESCAASSHRSSETCAARTLFATHYHELTALEEELPGRVRNLHVMVREWGDDIVFLHRIGDGRTDRSYGVHVAKLAGVPTGVIERARQILESLAVSRGETPPTPPPSGGSAPTAGAPQMSLFTEYVDHPAVERLRRIDLNALTPMQAFDALRELVQSVER